MRSCSGGSFLPSLLPNRGLLRGMNSRLGSTQAGNIDCGG